MSITLTARRFLRKAEGHYAIVLASLVIILAVHAFVGDNPWLDLLLEAAYLVTILSCLLASLGQRAWKFLLIASVVAEALTVVARLSDIAMLETPGQVLRIVVLFIALFAVLRDVLRSRKVTMDTVFAAASVYLLMALGWSAIYMVLEVNYPGSFDLTRSTSPGTWDENGQLIYFSVVTLTSVGYGDITPVSPQARTLASLEGLIGQLYVAIIIARLVALEISGRREPDEKEES